MIELERIPVTSPAGVSVFQKILTHGPIARIDVARRTGLSQAAVTKAVTPLVDGGFVVHAAQSPDRVETPGRPVSPLVVASNRAHVIGVKITAETVYATLTDLSAQRIASNTRSTRSAKVDDVLDAVQSAVADLQQTMPMYTISGLGVSVSGDVDTNNGVVRHSALMGWRDIKLRDLLENRLGLAVVVENDVRAFTVAEQMFGLGADASSLAVVTIGEGIGCGIFTNGDIVEGAHGVSGEIGHLPLAPGSLICSCGRRGCVETIASSKSIIERIRQSRGEKDLSLENAIDLAHAGDQKAREAFEEAGDVIGAALSALVNLLGPELVIIAGEGVAGYDLYEARIRKTFQEHAFGAALDCQIIVQSHTFDDWARGAAVTVIREIARGDKKLRTTTA